MVTIKMVMMTTSMMACRGKILATRWWRQTSSRVEGVAPTRSTFKKSSSTRTFAMTTLGLTITRVPSSRRSQIVPDSYLWSNGLAQLWQCAALQLMFCTQWNLHLSTNWHSRLPAQSSQLELSWCFSSVNATGKNMFEAGKKIWLTARRWSHHT